MLFVTDKVGPELKRIVEFLNEQMQPAEVLAIEINHYRNPEGMRMLVPQIIGKTARANSKKEPNEEVATLTNEEWLNKLEEQHGPQIANLCKHIVEDLIGFGLNMRVASSNKSASFAVESNGKTSPRFISMTAGDPAIGVWIGILEKFPEFESAQERSNLLANFKALGFPFRTEPADPSRSFPSIKLENLLAPGAREQLCDWIRALAERVSKQLQ